MMLEEEEEEELLDELEDELDEEELEEDDEDDEDEELLEEDEEELEEEEEELDDEDDDDDDDEEELEEEEEELDEEELEEDDEDDEEELDDEDDDDEELLEELSDSSNGIRSSTIPPSSLIPMSSVDEDMYRSNEISWFHAEKPGSVLPSSWIGFASSRLHFDTPEFCFLSSIWSPPCAFTPILRVLDLTCDRHLAISLYLSVPARTRSPCFGIIRDIGSPLVHPPFSMDSPDGVSVMDRLSDEQYARSLAMAS